MDSSALGMLLLLRDFTDGENSKVNLTHCRAEIKNILEISNFHNKQGGKLSIQVEDSGKVFDYKQQQRNLADNKELCGRLPVNYVTGISF